MKGIDSLEQVASEVRVCVRCGLHQGRKHAVPGEGPPDAKILFVGEGPGFHENEQGRPFVGAAGKFLNELLESIGLKREDVFITNVVKCRPPGNRDPLPDEVETCTGNYLDRQIELIDPKVIVTLGRFSMARFFPDVKISSIHGQARRVDGRLVVAMYHPAAALHQHALRDTLIKDFGKLPGTIASAEKAEREEEKSDEAPKQMSMF